VALVVIFCAHVVANMHYVILAYVNVCQILLYDGGGGAAAAAAIF
jgi:hypothetical protein